MRLIIAGILSGALIIYCLLRGKKGVREMRRILTELYSTREGKFLLVGGVISAILLIFMFLTGLVSIREMIEMERKIVEFCPFCV